MSVSVTVTKKQGSIMGTVIAAVQDDQNVVGSVDFYVTVIDTRVGQVPVRLGPYPADILRRPVPGVYEKDVLLDSVYQTRVETVLEMAEGGAPVQGAVQVFDPRAPLIADASILVEDQDTAAGDVGRMVFQGQVVQIDSSTKVATLNLDGRYALQSHTHAYLPLAGGTLTGALNVTGPVYSRMSYSDASGGVGFGFVHATSGVRRFAFGLVSTENGSNTGGNLTLWRYSDTGSFLNSVFHVNRASGLVSFTTAPTVGGSALATLSQLAAYLPLAGGNVTGAVTFGAAPTVNGTALALTSQLSAYLPLAGGNVTGAVTFGAAPTVNGTALALTSQLSSYLPLSGGTVTGAVGFGVTPTVNGTALALASQLTAYLPLAGGTITGQLMVKRDGGATPSYAGGQLELNSNGSNSVVLGFHRPGHSALALRHASASLLELVDQGGAYASYAGASFDTRGGNTSWGSARLYNGNEWGGLGNVYPTIGSTGGGGLIMLRRPHIPFHGDGSYVRMSADTGVSAYWDMGLMGDEFKVRRGNSSAAFLIDRFGTAYIDRTDTWASDIPDGRYHLNLRSASDIARRLSLGYSASGGPGDHGYGFIAAGRLGVTWTPLALQPSGGPVCVGGMATTSYALNVQGKAFASTGLVSGSTEWITSTASSSSIHGNGDYVETRTSKGIAVQDHTGYPQGYVAYEGTEFGLKNRNDGWAVRATTMGVTLYGDLRDQHGDLLPAVRVENRMPTANDLARQGTLWIVI